MQCSWLDYDLYLPMKLGKNYGSTMYRNPFFKTTINRHRRILVRNVSFTALWAEINPHFKGILEKFCSKTDLIFDCTRVKNR